jgi:glycosyltransferase involved in cell wall biosynthesis
VLQGEGYLVDILTYPEGQDRIYENVNIYRIPKLPGISNVQPGFSWKKIVYSAILIPFALMMLTRHKYDLVHAIEESSFIALLLRVLFKIDYIYDMDSSISQQLVEKKPSLKRFYSLFDYFEKLAIRQATGAIAVCQSLQLKAQMSGNKRVLLLKDISLLHRCSSGDKATQLRSVLKGSLPLILYVGNLEVYQGIDLLLQGFSLAHKEGTRASLAIIGGAKADIAKYTKKVKLLGLEKYIHFFGPKPVCDLGAYLAQADILVSPRSTGNNTPMKIYTYLDSGKVVLATSIESHTQSLNKEVAYLVEPTPEGMAAGIGRLVGSRKLRQELGHAGKRLAEEKHSWDVFRKTLSEFYKKVLS